MKQLNNVHNPFHPQEKRHSRPQDIKSRSKFGSNLQTNTKNKLNCFFKLKKKSKKDSKKNSKTISVNTKESYLTDLLKQKKQEYLSKKIYSKKKKLVKLNLPSLTKKRCFSFDLGRAKSQYGGFVPNKPPVVHKLRALKTHVDFDCIKELPVIKLRRNSQDKGLPKIPKTYNFDVLSRFVKVPTIHEHYIISTLLDDFNFVLIFKGYDISTKTEVVIKQFPLITQDASIIQKQIKVALMPRTKCLS
jgi:hypothetical protein